MNKKILQTRNPRVPLDESELEFLSKLVNKEITRSQPFDKDRLLFLLKLDKKLQTAR